MDKNHQLETDAVCSMGLDFLLNNPEELLRFMNNSGYDPDSLRSAITSDELQLAILSYFAANEPVLLSMCANAQIEPSRFMNCWNNHNNQG